jgi:hypothetical protein
MRLDLRFATSPLVSQTQFPNALEDIEQKLDSLLS